MRFFLLILIASVLALGPGFPVLAQDDIVKNGSFEVDSNDDGIPDEWVGRHLGPSDAITTDALEGTYSFKITGETGVRKSLRQRLRNTEAPQGLHFIFSTYSKISGGSREGGVYGLKIEIIYKDFTSDSFVLPFAISDQWNRVEREFVLPKESRKVILTLVYGDQTGTAWFDVVQALFFMP